MKDHLDRSLLATRTLGKNVTLGSFVEIEEGAKLGSNITIGSHCFIGNSVSLDDGVCIGCGVYIPAPVQICAGAVIEHNVTFSSPLPVISEDNEGAALEGIVISREARLGAGAVIFPGVTVGTGAIVEPGAIVSRSVPPYAVVSGNPARIISYVDSYNSLTKQKAFPQRASSSEEKISNLGVGGVCLHYIKHISDMRGDLSAGEFQKDIPFEVKRYFLVFNVPSAKTRGEHAHHLCHQFLICVRGSCAVVVDDGTARCEITLDSPSIGLHIPPKVWGIQYKYSSDAVLLVFASHYYDPDDYIRDYEEFLSLSRKEQ